MFIAMHTNNIYIHIMPAQPATVAPLFSAGLMPHHNAVLLATLAWSPLRHRIPRWWVVPQMQPTHQPTGQWKLQASGSRRR